MKTVDAQLTLELSEKVQVTPKACWRNSLDVMLYVRMTDRPALEDIVYVEGWTRIHVTTPPIWIEHAWLEFGDTIVDVTLSKDDLSPDDYYGVLRYDYEGVMAGISEHGMLPLFANQKETRRQMNTAWSDVVMSDNNYREVFYYGQGNLSAGA